MLLLWIAGLIGQECPIYALLLWRRKRTQRRIEQECPIYPLLLWIAGLIEQECPIYVIEILPATVSC
ncbi:MAG: hypothetical protein RIK87_04040 [Fuerstiella sp.]